MNAPTVGDWQTHRGRDTLLWPLLNQARELVPAHLIHCFGPAMYDAMSRDWAYGLRQREDVVPINHVLRFRTFGRQVRLRQEVGVEVRHRLVADRDGAGALRRAHLHALCTMRDAADADSEPLGTGEFWMALSRPLMPPGQRHPQALPAKIADWPQSAPGPDDLITRPIAAYGLDGDGVRTANDTVVFHFDRSDLYQHVNTVVYLDMGLDALAKAAYGHGLDAGRLRFHDLIVQFRKPFMPGQAAQIETDLRLGERDFEAAVRYRHLDAAGSPSAKPSTALLVAGPLAA